MKSSVDSVARIGGRIVDEVSRAVVGKEHVLKLVLAGMLANGHILLEDFPGLAKTLIARSFTQVTGLSFARIQFTPDLLPSDVTGSVFYDQQRGDLVFRPGPIFTNVLLGDEINRAPPKTQAALLEGMQERQVSTEGVTRPLPEPFVLIATQNPIEYEGTYALPEAQLDRFLIRLSVGYPEREDEWTMAERRLARRQDEVVLQAACDRETILGLQQAVETVHVAPSIGFYIIDLVTATRRSRRVELGAGPRGTLALIKLARAWAALHGRDFVTPGDVKAVAVPALAHRLVLKPEAWVQRIRGEQVIEDCLAEIPTPAAEDLSAGAA